MSKYGESLETDEGISSFERLFGVPSSEQRAKALEEEKYQAVIGYMIIMLRSKIFGELVPADSLPDRFFYILEEIALLENLPESLQLANLRGIFGRKDLVEIYRDYYAPVEGERLSHGRKDGIKQSWRRSVANIFTSWDQAPEVKDERKRRAEMQLEKSPMFNKLTEDVRSRVREILINYAPVEDEDRNQEYWGDVDRGIRNVYNNNTRMFLQTRRLLLEVIMAKTRDLLKEDPANSSAKEIQRIAKRYNRILRLAELARSGYAVAKAIHHEQPGSILRKTGDPYIVHPLAVLSRTIKDVIPYVLDDGIDNPKKFSHQLMVLLLLAAPTHDLVEDSELRLKAVMKKIKEYLDYKNTKNSQKIEKAIKAGYMTEETFDLLNAKIYKQLEKVLRVLSSNSTLDNRELELALKANLFGDDTEKLITQAEAKGKAIKPMREFTPDKIQDRVKNKKQQPAKCYINYPQISDPKFKLEKFLIRLESITGSKTAKQAALMVKIEDRVDNLLTMKGLSYEYQLRNIRGAFSRLAAYAMLDHDRKKMPLFDTLPRLLRAIISEYERLFHDQKHGEENLDLHFEIKDYDDEYYKQAQLWLQQIEEEMETNSSDTFEISDTAAGMLNRAIIAD